MPFPVSFFFIFVFSTVNSKNVNYKIFAPTTGFEQQPSGIGSDHSATSTAPDQNIFPIVRSMHRTKIFPIQINAFFARSHLQQLFVTHREELQKIVFTIIKLKCNPFTLSLSFFLFLKQVPIYSLAS